MVTRTFLDAGVLIAAFRGAGALGAATRDALDDPDRQFVASDVLRLEVTPKSVYHGRAAETQFYEAYFSSVAAMIVTTPDIVRNAESIAAKHGLSAADALHIAAATEAAATEFITTERNTKPLFRVSDLKIISLA
jgi:predicted nucleic acid-binding protein